MEQGWDCIVSLTKCFDLDLIFSITELLVSYQFTSWVSIEWETELQQV